jgi:hypothetical protein
MEMWLADVGGAKEAGWWCVMAFQTFVGLDETK